MLSLANERHAALFEPIRETGNGIIPCEVNHFLMSQPMRAEQSENLHSNHNFKKSSWISDSDLARPIVNGSKKNNKGWIHDLLMIFWNIF